VVLFVCVVPKKLIKPLWGRRNLSTGGRVAGLLAVLAVLADSGCSL
jgi:hypothetical protein